MRSRTKSISPKLGYANSVNHTALRLAQNAAGGQSNISSKVLIEVVQDGDDVS
jgi:hypothetical protein